VGVNQQDVEDLRVMLEDMNRDTPSWLSPCDIQCWHSVPVLADGVWLCPPTGPERMNLPCTLCGRNSVTVWQQDRAWGFNTIWACSLHEQAFQALLGEFSGTCNQRVDA
jgi:hypothetical protein